MKCLLRTIKVLLLGLIIFSPALSHASVTLKVNANNPSSIEERDIPIKSYLPKGVRPEDVINADGLEIGYDVKRDQSYVHKTVTLEAQGSVTFNIEIEDIWLIDEIETDGILSRVSDLAEDLKNTEYADISAQIQNDIRKKISELVARQEDNLIFKVGPAQHMKAYEVNSQELEDVKAGVADLENYLSIVEANTGKSGKGTAMQTRAAKLIEANRVKNMILNYGEDEKVSCLVEEALKTEDPPVNLESPETVLMRIDFENPSAVKRQTAPFRLLLMKETDAGDVIDSDILHVGFDFDRNLYYLFNDNVELAPSETRTFEVTLNNKWVLNRKSLYSLKVYIDNLNKIEGDTPEFTAIRELGQQLIDEIYGLLGKTDPTELTERNVLAFRKDVAQVTDIRRSVQRMEDLLVKEDVTPELKVMEMEKLCADTEKEGESPQKAAGAMGILAALRARLNAGTIFKGKSVSTASTWRIIYYIIMFLGLISGVFYFVNIRQQKSTMFDSLTGAFARAYAQDRFREELRVAKGGNNKCSLLVMDIDKFKGINDTYGHAVGDTILKEFVIAVRKGIRATDILGRFGGDEFMIVLPTGSKEIALRIADSIARIVEGTAVKVNPKVTLNITTSIGVATYPEDSTTAEDLFNKADQALYKVKKRGGNGAEVFGERM